MSKMSRNVFQWWYLPPAPPHTHQPGAATQPPEWPHWCKGSQWLVLAHLSHWNSHLRVLTGQEDLVTAVSSGRPAKHGQKAIPTHLLPSRYGRVWREHRSWIRHLNTTCSPSELGKLASLQICHLKLGYCHPPFRFMVNAKYSSQCLTHSRWQNKW